MELLLSGGDRRHLAALQALGKRLQLPLVAAGDVHMHRRQRRALQDTLTAIRLRTTVASAGQALFPNAERHLRSRERLVKLYPPELLAETLRIAERCRFSLDELRYEYPQELVPPGHTPSSYLRALTEAGLQRRYPQGTNAKVRGLVEQELNLIAELGYEPFFLTVTTSSSSRAAATSSARGAARRRIQRCVSHSGSPRSTRHAWTCCSSASSRASATSRPTSMSTSSMNGARR